jgi:hypothetical protein
MKEWRVIYIEPDISESCTFLTFDEAWSYANVIPEKITYIPYNEWFYIPKKEAVRKLDKETKILISWCKTAKIILIRL